MNKNLKEFIIALFVFFTCVLIFYGAVYFINLDNNSDENDVKEVEVVEKDKDKEKEKEKEPYVEPYVNNLPTYRNDYGNPNIMGMIEIPGIFSNILVARSSDNEFYLDRNLWNQYDGIGVPFFDFRNVDLDNAKQINIYGHNSPNPNILDRLPMSRLINLLDANTFNTYKDLYLYTDTKKVHYEIIGAKIISKDNNSHMTINFYDDEDFINHTNNLLNGSINRRDVSINKSDRILVMQTCYYTPPNSLVIIICKTV